MAQEVILVQASPLRLAGEWARSCPAAAALPAAAGTGRVRRAPGAASSRASFEPEREQQNENWVGRARRGDVCKPTRPTPPRNPRWGRSRRFRAVKPVWQGWARQARQQQGV